MDAKTIEAIYEEIAKLRERVAVLESRPAHASLHAQYADMKPHAGVNGVNASAQNGDTHLRFVRTALLAGFANGRDFGNPLTGHQPIVC